MGEFHSTMKDGVMPNVSVDPKVPITSPGGERLDSTFKDGNYAGAGGGVSIPMGEQIAGPTPGPIATPFQEGAIAGKNKG